jgi:putative ABC transport system ATP-binding protein
MGEPGPSGTGTPAEDGHTTALPEEATAPVVVFDQVARIYPGHPAVVALRPCDLRIGPGDYLAVTGPSGSGKSTLLNLLGLLDSPSAGCYLLDGQDVSRLGERRRTALRSHRLGFVFQFFHLLPYRTSLENVELGMLYQGIARHERRARALEALTRVGLQQRRDALPPTLSGGERQRVAIARSVANQPRLLLCDEPTGNLDTATSNSILDLLDELHEGGLTLVVVTHDPEVAVRATRQVTIRDGLVEEPDHPVARLGPVGGGGS